MILLNGWFFLDYIFSSLADAGIYDVAFVVAFDHDVLRCYYESDVLSVRVCFGFVV